MAFPDFFHIGTCSWKYDSWRGLIYPESGLINHLCEYSRHYRTVEVDQWFWSLFKGDKVVLPKDEVVRGYVSSVPDDFIFAVKVPNSITLTHHYSKNKQEPLQPNPHFLSVELMKRFLAALEPLGTRIGPLIFQFEYLNKHKMSGRNEFFRQFKRFIEQLPSGYHYCLETRNPNYLGVDYFTLLAECNLSHVFLEGYYMPSIFDLYEKHRNRIKNSVVIRLHGSGRNEIEKQSGKDWSRIVAPKDRELTALGRMLADLADRQVETYLYVNNHFEGSAPRTVSRILAKMGA